MARYIDADNLEELEQLEYNYEPKQEFPAVPWYKVDDVWKILDGMDGADVALVVHGRWEEVLFHLPLSDGHRTAYRASCCNTTWDARTNYCPNCGAKMDLEG